MRHYRPLSTAVVARLQHELQAIADGGFAPYFLIVADLVRWCRRQGIPVLGRGSAANSLVAYVLDITPVDPLEHDLYFERFLHPDRPDPPTSTWTCAGAAAMRCSPTCTRSMVGIRWR